MIVDLFFVTIGGLLYMISSVLSLVNYVIPTQVSSALTWAFGNLVYVAPFFPVDTLMDVLSAFLSFLGVWYGFKLILFIWSIIPWVGKNANH